MFMNKLGQPLTTIVVSILIVITLLLLGLVPLLSPTWEPVFSTFLNLGMLIKQRPFIIYILENFIILSLFLLKVSSKPKKTTIHVHHEQPVVPTSSGYAASSPCADVSEILFSWGPGRDDTWTWWCQIINSQNPEKVIYDEKPEKNETERGEGGSDVGGEKVEKEEGDDTLDATWGAIMEAKRKGSGPQLKKSDTWTTSQKGRSLRGYDQVEMKKWRTFNETGKEKEERENRGGGGWRRMEVVITDHEELKKRADAFIERFTHDMRLQRLESDQRFFEMINRGL